ncbi:MAG: hypothetical protein HZA50_18410 [Planctomycetes bacterium]|nr:hypothetical protein [Planctomycetota bacterium]
MDSFPIRGLDNSNIGRSPFIAPVFAALAGGERCSKSAKVELRAYPDNYNSYDGVDFVAGQEARAMPTCIRSSSTSDEGMRQKRPVPQSFDKNRQSAALDLLDDPIRVACVGLPCIHPVFVETQLIVIIRIGSKYAN